MGKPKERMTLESVSAEFNTLWGDNEELTASNALQKLEGFNGFIFWKVTCENSHHRIFLTSTGKLHFEAHPKAIDWNVEIPSNQVIYESEGNTGFACRCAEVRDIWRQCFQGVPVSNLPAGQGTTVDLDATRKALRSGQIGPNELIYKKSVSMRRAMLQLLALRDLRKFQHSAHIRIKEHSFWDSSVLRARVIRRGKKRGDRRFVENFSRRIVDATCLLQGRYRKSLLHTRKRTRYQIRNLLTGGPHLFGCRIPKLLTINNVQLITMDLRHQERWFENPETAIRVSYFTLKDNHVVYRQGWAERTFYSVYDGEITVKRWRVVEDKTNKIYWGEEYD